jgi:steroid delta-isomerase-like uncharacterized protein
MTTEQNKAIVKKLFEEGMNQRKLSMADEVIGNDFVNHGIPNAKKGPEGFREIIQQFLDAFPDMKINVEFIISEGDMVATKGTWTGTNKGSFMGMPVTNKKVNVGYADFWKLKNGKCIENWVEMDIAGLMQQIGVIPANA